MDGNIRENKSLSIKKISIEGYNLKDILKDDFVDKLNENFSDFSLINFALIVDKDKPSNLISIGHVSSEDYKNNVLTVNAENEENLSRFLKTL